jgi:hypothetical protein
MGDDVSRCTYRSSAAPAVAAAQPSRSYLLERALEGHARTDVLGSSDVLSCQSSAVTILRQQLENYV